MGEYFNLDSNQEIHFPTKGILRCALPHHRHGKLRSGNTDVGIGTPFGEIAGRTGKPFLA